MAKAICLVACLALAIFCVADSRAYNIIRRGLPIYWIPKSYVKTYQLSETTMLPIVCGTAMISFMCENPGLPDGNYGRHIVPIFRKKFICELKVGVRELFPCE